MQKRKYNTDKLIIAGTDWSNYQYSSIDWLIVTFINTIEVENDVKEASKREKNSTKKKKRHDLRKTV